MVNALLLCTQRGKSPQDSLGISAACLHLDVQVSCHGRSLRVQRPTSARTRRASSSACCICAAGRDPNGSRGRFGDAAVEAGM
jgi:hypothetical protein